THEIWMQRSRDDHEQGADEQTRGIDQRTENHRPQSSSRRTPRYIGRMQVSRILREGFIAGLIGAGAVALWFLIVDVIAGRPFFTPAMLGSAAFWLGQYLRHLHPKIAATLKLHPLGETDEGE